MSPTDPRRFQADRNLLFGIIALQMDFVSRDALIAAMHAWVLDKAKDLGQILVEQDALSHERRAMLEPLVAEHVRHHGNNPQKSLASVSSIRSVKDELDQIADTEVKSSLTHVSAAPSSICDPLTTRTEITAGTPTSSGLRFRILRPHARGGIGDVFIAEDQELHREVALKQIQDQQADDPSSRSRFLLEAEITGGLEHPSIVPVYGLGQYADGRPFYAMRFVKGDSLKDAIRRYHAKEMKNQGIGERAVEFRKLLGRFVDVCNAIGYAHARGVLHRDLKPGNVMLGQYGETLVVDWGLAKVTGTQERGEEPSVEATLRPPSASGSGATLAGTALGTPAFMSPEQAAGRLNELGPATDIYSLGATLYSLLTGKTPFLDAPAGEILVHVEKGEFAKPRQLNPEIPRALEAICLKAMSLRPGNRYKSVRALADDIEHWLADEPVTALVEPVGERARRWARRHRPVVAGAAALLVTAVVGLSIGSLLLSQANSRTREQRDLALANFVEAQHQRDQAVHQRKRAEQAEQTAKSNEAKAKESAATARAEEQKAKQSAAEAKALFSFLQDKVLAAARPKGQAGGLGREATIRDAVDAAEPQISKSFLGQPTVEASIRDTLARTYTYLGKAQRAIEQSEKALTLRRAKLGPNHPDTLNSMSNLAIGYLDAGRLAEAIALHAETLKIRKAVLGPEHPDTLRSMGNLVIGYRTAGRLNEAIALNEETLPLMKAKLGADHPDTLRCMSSLAYNYFLAGRPAEAVALDEETLRLRKAKLGPNHPDTLRSMNNLALAYYGVGRLAEAIALNAEVLRLRKAELGPNHPNTLNSMGNLALAYRNAGRLPEAIALDEDTLKLQKTIIGPDHADTIATMNNLAADYFCTGRLAEARPLYESSLKLAKAKLGPNHPHTIDALTGLADVYTAQKETSRAEALLMEALAATKDRQKVAPLAPLTLAGVQAALGDCLLREGKFAAAEPALRECLAVQQKNAANDWATFQAQSLLGGALLGQKEFTEAEPLLQAGYEGMKKCEVKIYAPDKFRLSDAAERLVKLYDAWGKKDRADLWRKKLDEERQNAARAIGAPKPRSDK
jgi:serine/threonine protein kinase